MTTVMVSGCFDILHAGHIDFLTRAHQWGDTLCVSYAGRESLASHKGRVPAMPDAHKEILLRGLRCVDIVVRGDSLEVPGLDFLDHFRRIRPDFLIATEDDRYAEVKGQLCATCGWGCKYLQIPKGDTLVSTTSIRRALATPLRSPLRVDFAGGWLDVPGLSRADGRVVNCAITPGVELSTVSDYLGRGLGASAARALLDGESPVESDMRDGGGWQDPAVILEGGLCVWQSGPRPELIMKVNPREFLGGKLLVYDTGTRHLTSEIREKPRDYARIVRAGRLAETSVRDLDIRGLRMAVGISYEVQLDEGMPELPRVRGATCKYCGSGWGGFALYLFSNVPDREACAGLPGFQRIEPLSEGGRGI